MLLENELKTIYVMFISNLDYINTSNEWEHKILPLKIYSNLVNSLDEIGRMLGGWKKSLQEKTPAKQ